METKSAIKIMLGILSFVIAFHIGILIKLIPYDLTWGGRLKNDQEMYVFETVSILINLFLIAVLLMKGKFVKYQVNEKIVNGILWVFLSLFIVNTIGNIFAQANFEKALSLLTLILALLIWVILKKKKHHAHPEK